MVVEEKLPHWAAAYKKIILCQPSSAATERVFSIMKSSFNSEQNLALEDYMEVSLMLQCNKRDFFLFKLPAEKCLIMPALCSYALAVNYAPNYASIICKTLIIGQNYF